MAWACTRCGFGANKTDAAVCRICGVPGPAGRIRAEPVRAAPALDAGVPESVHPASATVELATREPTISPIAAAVPRASRELATARGDLHTGTVLSVDASRQIAEPFNVWRALTLGLLGLLFLPFVFAFGAVLLGVSVVFALFGLHRLAAAVNPFNWLTLWRMIIPQRGPTSAAAMVPMMTARLRLQGGQELSLRFEGHLVSGDLTVGDTLEVDGIFRAGTLYVRAGFNHSTGARVAFEPNRWKVGLLMLVLALGLSVPFLVSAISHWLER